MVADPKPQTGIFCFTNCVLNAFVCVCVDMCVCVCVCGTKHIHWELDYVLCQICHFYITNISV